MNVREVIRLIESGGCLLVGTRGWHRQFKYFRKPGRVTIAGKFSDNVKAGTHASILKQAGLWLNLECATPS